MQEKQLEQLNKLAKVFNPENVITSAEIEQVLVGILQIMDSFKKSNDSLNKETKQVVETLLERVIEENTRLKTDLEKNLLLSNKELNEKLSKFIDDKTKIFEEKISSANSILDEIQSIEVKDGKDADEEKIIAEIVAILKREEIKEETADSIIEKINTSDFKIDASRIKNLPTSNIPINTDFAISKSIYQLADVFLDNLSSGDALLWNSTTNRWENGAVSGGAWSSITGTPTEVAYFDALGNGTSDNLFTRDPANQATLIGMLQNAGVDAAGIAIGDDLLGLPGTNGIVMRRGDDADVVGNTLIGIIDATPLGAPSAYMGFSRADDFVTGEFYQQFFFAGNGGISAGDGTDSGLFQVGVGGAELGADNNDGGGNDIIAITADLNGGAGAQQLRGRYQDGTNDYGWQLASDGITFDFDNFSGASGTFYTFPTADATVDGQVLTGHADGTTTWEAVVATAALTDTYIGFGDSSNILTGDADFTYGSLYSLVSQVTPDNSDSLLYSTASFTGSGLDDLTLTWDSSIYASNKYGGNLTITIDTTGSPDTFNWYFTGGYSQTIGSGTSVAITGGVQTLNDADGNKIAEIQFGATTGHTATDHWNAHTSLGGNPNPKGYLLQDNLNHEFLVANSGGGTYKFGDDGTNGGSQWWGNGTQLFIADNNGELGLFAPRYLRFEHPVVGTYTAALVDMQNKIWNNYGKFRVRNATTSSDWFDVDPATQEIRIGDITSVGNDTLFTINDSSAIITGTLDGVFTLQNVAGADGFVLDTANKTSQLGFISGTGINGNYLLIDDANHDSRIVTDSSGYFSVKGGSNILFQVNASGRAVSIGDVLAAVNGTKVVVDDVSQLVTITNVPTYADDTAAAAGGLTTGQLYKTTTLGITSLNIVP